MLKVAAAGKFELTACGWAVLAVLSLRNCFSCSVMPTPVAEGRFKSCGATDTVATEWVGFVVTEPPSLAIV